MLATNGSCAKPETVEWTSIDVDALRSELDEPTAPLTEETLDELRSAPKENVLLWLALDSLLDVFPVATTTAAPTPTETSLDLEGTNVYIKFACPGAEQTVPDPDFQYGFLQFYSPTLSEENIEAFAVQGDLYGVAEDCTIGRFDIAGSMRFFISTLPPTRAIVPDLEFEYRGEVPSEGALTVPMLEENAIQRTLLFVEEGTLTLENSTDPMDTAFVLHGSTGEHRCDLLMEPACPPLD